MEKLQEAEQKHDFYTRLYRNYSANLLKLVIYARSLITNDHVCKYMESYRAGMPEGFQPVSEMRCLKEPWRN